MEEVSDSFEEFVPARVEAAGEEVIPFASCQWLFAPGPRLANVNRVLLNDLATRAASPCTDWDAMSAGDPDDGMQSGTRVFDVVDSTMEGRFRVVTNHRVDKILRVVI